MTHVEASASFNSDWKNNTKIVKPIKKKKGGFQDYYHLIIWIEWDWREKFVTLAFWFSFNNQMFTIENKCTNQERNDESLAVQDLRSSSTKKIQMKSYTGMILKWGSLDTYL